MTDLIDTTEMYLKTIFELVEDGVVPMRARIAERLGHSGPTVSQTVARMQRDGLLTIDSADRHLEFTEHGLRTATRVMRKHRLAERLLVDVLGMELAHVHDEACRWEHVMSDRVERRILALLGAPQRSPYGNRIPGLEELDVSSATALEPAVRATELAGEDDTEVRLVRIGEPAQVDAETVALLVEAGVVPGAVVTLRGEAGWVRLVAVGGGTVSLPEDVAAHLFVAQD